MDGITEGTVINLEYSLTPTDIIFLDALLRNESKAKAVKRIGCSYKTFFCQAGRRVMEMLFEAAKMKHLETKITQKVVKQLTMMAEAEAMAGSDQNCPSNRDTQHTVSLRQYLAQKCALIRVDGKLNPEEQLGERALELYRRLRENEKEAK